MTDQENPHINPHDILHGTLFPEPIEVIVSLDIGNSLKVIGKGLYWFSP